MYVYSIFFSLLFHKDKYHAGLVQVVALDQITKCIWWLHTETPLALGPKKKHVFFKLILGVLSHKGFLHYSMYTNSPTAGAQGESL